MIRFSRMVSAAGNKPQIDHSFELQEHARGALRGASSIAEEGSSGQDSQMA